MAKKYYKMLIAVDTDFIDIEDGAEEEAIVEAIADECCCVDHPGIQVFDPVPATNAELVGTDTGHMYAFKPIE